MNDTDSMEKKDSFDSCKSLVFNAAREGKLSRLKVFLDQRPKEEVKCLVSAVTNGTTPLLMACRHGHHEIVRYFVEDCVVDIEQVGSVTFDGETIDGAPPLWCAAAAGHLVIVQNLIRHGAQVNHTTFTSSTPLRAACFDGHFDIVKYLVEHKADIELANRHGHTCLMIACYKGHLQIARYLLQLGAHVNRKSVKGNTALHDCAESGSLEIMKLLLKHKAKMDVDAYGMTPLMAASVAGHTTIVQYLVSRPDCSKQERIDAYELLGATFVDKKRDMMGALKFWNLAMDDRYRDKTNIIGKPEQNSIVPAYEFTMEARTKDDLDDVICDPDKMRMQALLIRERILGPAHPDTSYYIRYRGAVYADAGNFERCIMLWMYALDMQQKALEALNPMTQSSLLSFAELFAYMQAERNGEKVSNFLMSDDVIAVFIKGASEIERGVQQLQIAPLNEKDTTNFNRALLIFMHLICLVAKLKNLHKEINIKKSLYRLLRLSPRGAKGFTLLHLACDKDTSSVGRYPVCSFPSLEVVHLLVECGASVNAVNGDSNTPLHVAALNSSNSTDTIIKYLIENGAHFDGCNAAKKNAMDLIQGTSDIPWMNYITLQCLAAKAVLKYGIVYKGHIPKKLETFVELH
ncbi:protein fem-1 homolog C [Saccoglossus kowalevskii]|uniref:Protein fem-1 homolog C n=1 Tax=Saccoglossus kowalevskii TaxID=10224 RepID=A0ABM0GYX2_SACKO|nr:PREDICTED: protein fem-1 homolog C [Saccoglossus kowalevskii]